MDTRVQTAKWQGEFESHDATYGLTFKSDGTGLVTTAGLLHLCDEYENGGERAECYTVTEAEDAVERYLYLHGHGRFTVEFPDLWDDQDWPEDGAGFEWNARA